MALQAQRLEQVHSLRPGALGNSSLQEQLPKFLHTPPALRLGSLHTVCCRCCQGYSGLTHAQLAASPHAVQPRPYLAVAVDAQQLRQVQQPGGLCSEGGLMLQGCLNESGAVGHLQATCFRFLQGSSE